METGAPDIKLRVQQFVGESSRLEKYVLTERVLGPIDGEMTRTSERVKTTEVRTCVHVCTVYVVVCVCRSVCGSGSALLGLNDNSCVGGCVYDT